MPIITITPAAMRTGDRFAPYEAATVIDTVERNMDDLSAYLLTFTDGTHYHAHGRQAYPIDRA